MPFHVLSSIAIIYCDITAIVYDVMKHVHFLLKYNPRFLCQLDAFGAIISIANVKSLLTMNGASKCEFTFRTAYIYRIIATYLTQILPLISVFNQKLTVCGGMTHTPWLSYRVKKKLLCIRFLWSDNAWLEWAVLKFQPEKNLLWIMW